jgi:dihydropteroate synthase
MKKQVMKIGERFFNLSKPCIVGVVNITPDSFSDGGIYLDKDAAFKYIEKIVLDGADIIEIGAESSRPGADPITEDEEIKRLEGIMSSYSSHFSLPLSIDTYKAGVADYALSMGADMVNDISAFKADPGMVSIINKYDVPVCLMHMRGTPKNMQNNPVYNDVVEEIKNELLEVVNIAKMNNIEKIILDPGIGFGKTTYDNLEILKHVGEICDIGYPLMIGTSRKSFIGKITKDEVDSRIEGSLASNILAYLKGATFFRVHDVKSTKKALQVVTAIENPDEYMRV